MKRTVALTLVLAAVACTPKKDASEQAAPAVTVGVSELVSDYKANEVRADGKWKGKRLEVAGIVGDIKKNAFDQIYVTLGTGKQFEIENAHANFPKESTEKASALDKGATITVNCKCDGKILTAVNLTDCKFVGTPQAPVAAKESPAKPALTSAEVCQKLIDAGVAKTCAPTPTGQEFDIVGLAPKKGNIEVIAEEAKFAQFLAGLAASPPTSGLRPYFSSTKARTVVHLTKGATPALEAKAKAVVDAL